MHSALLSPSKLGILIGRQVFKSLDGSTQTSSGYFLPLPTWEFSYERFLAVKLPLLFWIA